MSLASAALSNVVDMQLDARLQRLAVSLRYRLAYRKVVVQCTPGDDVDVEASLEWAAGTRRFSGLTYVQCFRS